MRHDDRPHVVKALGRARAAAYREGEYVGQENFMAADDILALGVAAGARAGARVLDLCCGVGGPGNFIARRTACRMLGVDRSESALRLAREAARQRGLASEFVAAEVEHLPFDAPFDAVLLVETMLAFEDRVGLLARVCSLLRAGGRFGMTFEEGAPLTEAERRRMPGGENVWLTPLDEMMELIAGAGLAVRSVEEQTRRHADLAGRLGAAFRDDRAAIVRELGAEAVDEILTAHALWAEWLASGRVRKFSIVAERPGLEEGSSRKDARGAKGAKPLASFAPLASLREASMEEPEQDRFARYLAAKKGVDDRSLNERVWQGLAAALADAAARGPLEIVELGAGIGTMIERVAERSLVSSAVYTAVDARSSNRDLARRRLPERLAGLGYAARGRDDGPIVFERGDDRLEVRLVAGDAFEYLSHRPPQSCDLALAHAFLDEVDADAFLPLLVSRLRPGALCYFSLCFDGVTSLQPEIDARFDATIEALYHETMDRRVVAGRSSGDSRTGRHLFERLRRLGLELLSAGSSDWVVFAGSARYEGDEAFFLHHLVDVIRGALDGEPRLDARRFAEWIARRHEQIDRGELVWISHNMDLLARVPPAANELT